MREAALLERRDPAQATAAWTAIDHQLTDNAAWVPTANLRDVALVSRRLRNYQYNPIWGFLADQVLDPIARCPTLVQHAWGSPLRRLIDVRGASV